MGLIYAVPSTALRTGLNPSYLLGVDSVQDLERLSEAPVDAVEEPMQPAHVSLWLKEKR